MVGSAGQRSEVVRGRIDAAIADEIVSFWGEQGALAEAAARQRLGDVVCVRRNGSRVVGVNSVYAATAPVVGRRLWIYRRFLTPGADEDAGEDMLAAAREALAAEFTGAPGEPIGLCVLVPRDLIPALDPRAVWPATGLLHAGYADDGTQVRVTYFDDARV